MKIHELIESQDWQKIKDPALRWLGRFTYENAGKNPDPQILSKLIKTYPNPAGNVYRGINFTLAESWQNFMEKFSNKKDAILEFPSVTSWTEDITTADQFARTQPTYQLNLAVMTAHAQQQSQRENLSGYRGVILSMQLEAGVAIDVNAAGVGHENEIVVPPGSYSVHIHEIIKKYEHQLSDQDVNVNQVILNTTRESFKNKNRENRFFDYVLHHHAKTLSVPAQKHVFHLFAPLPGEEVFRTHVDTFENIFNKQEIWFSYNVPSIRLFEMADRGVFDAQTNTKIQQLGKKIIKQALPWVEKYAAVATNNWNPSVLNYISKFTGDYRITQAIQKAVRKEIDLLNSKVRDINKIEDTSEQRQAIEKYKTRMVDLLSLLKS